MLLTLKRKMQNNSMNPEHTWRTYDRYELKGVPRAAQVMREPGGQYLTRIVDENGIVVAAPRVTSETAGKAAMENIPHE